MTGPTGFSTRAIHHAYDPLENEGALTPPLHLTSTFAFESAEAGGEMFAGDREGHIYSRISNPTCDLLERRIATLEGAEAGLALASGMTGGIQFMNALNLVQRAVSLGDSESLIQHPASMTHSTYTPEERAEHGISDGLIRLSVGLEVVADIITDLEQALPMPARHAAE